MWRTRRIPPCGVVGRVGKTPMGATHPHIGRLEQEDMIRGGQKKGKTSHGNRISEAERTEEQGGNSTITTKQGLEPGQLLQT